MILIVDQLLRAMHPVESMLKDWINAISDVSDVSTDENNMPDIADPIVVKIDTVDPTGEKLLYSKLVVMEPGKTYDLNGNEIVKS